ncbi:MAG: DUF3786 domain-containing protein [Candidatus Bathyarchaeota archaeon]|nr:DUF3786 domain-containing protein [Candidatus Bathyarchaeota archaeon]
MSHPAELWTWENCKEKIKTLSGRNGYPDNAIIPFLGYILDTRTGTITDTFSGEAVESGSKSYHSVTHTICYVLSAYSEAQDKLPTGKPITSKQLRGNHFVCRGYTGETITLVKHFASNPDKLVQAVEVLGGEKTDFQFGDIAVKVNVLPRVPITIVMSLADEEFPAEARIYFDATLENYLDSEQTYFMTHLMVKRLVELSEKSVSFLELY